MTNPIQYKLILVQESEEIMKEVLDWAENRGGFYNWWDHKGGLQIAVAEYIANQRGLTFYEGKNDFLIREFEKKIQEQNRKRKR